MPTYTINTPQSGNDAWAQGASALASAFTPDYKGQAEAALMGVRADQSRASAGASHALTRERNANSELVEREGALLAQMDGIFREEGVTDPLEMSDIAARFGIQIDPVEWTKNMGKGNLALGARAGLPDDQMQDLQIGSGMSMANTIAGFDADQRRQSSEFVMGEAADTARANTKLEFDRDYETVDVIRNGQPISIYRNRMMVGDQPIMSKTDQEGFALGQMPMGEQQEILRGTTGERSASDMVSVLRTHPDGSTEQLTLPAEDALPTDRMITTPDMEDLVTDGDGSVSPFQYEGTGMAAQSSNVLMALSDKIENGTATPEEQMRYAMAHNSLFGPKTEIRNGPDGNAYSVQVTPSIPDGFATPGAAALEAVAAQTGGPGMEPPVAETAPVLPASETAPAVMAPPALSNVSNATPIPGVASTPPKPKTESQARYGQYSKRIMLGAGNLISHMGYNPETGTFSEDGFKPGIIGDFTTSLPGAMGRMFTGNDREVYDTAVAQAINPLIRADSGAAVPEGEYPRYYDQYIPQSFQSEEVAAMKLDHLIMTQLAFQEVAETPAFLEAMRNGEITGSYAAAQRILHSARDRVYGELNMTPRTTEEVNAIEASGETPDPAAVEAETAGDGNITLPGGIIAEKVN
jgi:hypothetical protein